MKIWSGHKDVDEAVRTITTLINENNQIPQILIDSYRETLKRSSRGMVQRFYEKLTEQCQDGLKYFLDNEGGVK